jgi:GT2 family glycosyltransferase
VCSILDHLPADGEIVVVDDFSSDGSSDDVQIDERVSVLRLARHTGAPIGRNLGAAKAQGSIIVFADAHVTVPAGWFEGLADPLSQPLVGAVGPAICDMADPSAKGYGLGFTGPRLDWAWLPPAGSCPYPVPLLGAGFMALRKEVFVEVGGFDEGLIIFGMEDSELSLRLWLLGYECWIAPDVEVLHRSYPPDAVLPSYYEHGETALHNTLRVGLLHFSGSRLRELFAAFSREEYFPAAFARAVDSDVWERREALARRRSRDDASFFDHYGWAAS